MAMPSDSEMHDRLTREVKRLYLREEDQLYSVQLDDGSYPSEKGKHLNDDVLNKHLLQELTVAIRPTDYKTGKSKIGAIDVDIPHDGKTYGEVYAIAIRLAQAARKHGITCEIEWSGRRGFHVWFSSNEPIATAEWLQLFQQLAIEANFRLREYFPRGEHPTASGKGQYQIKLPLSIHRQTGKRSCFLPEKFVLSDMEADSTYFEGNIPDVPFDLAEQIRILEGFKATPSDHIREFCSARSTLQSSSSTEKTMPLVQMPTTPSPTHAPSAKLDRLPEGQFPTCINHVLNRGAPIDAEYNASNLRLAMFIKARGIIHRAEELFEKMAMASSQHPSSKSHSEKVTNGMSAFKSVMDSQDKYQDYHCNLIHSGFSELLLKGGGCAGRKEVCFAWEVPGASADELFDSPRLRVIESDVISYLIQKPDFASRVTPLFTIASNSFVGAMTGYSIGKNRPSTSVYGILWDCFQLAVQEGEEFNLTNILGQFRLLVTDPYDASLPTDEVLLKLETHVHDEYARLNLRPVVTDDSFYRGLKELRDRSIKLKMLAISKSLQSAASAGFNEVLPELGRSLQEIKKLEAESASELLTHETDMANFKNRLFSSRRSPISTPSENFNYLINGGLHRGKLYILGAPPKTGKTAFLWWLATQIAGPGALVIFISCELSKDNLLLNDVSRRSIINSTVLEKETWRPMTPELVELKSKVERAMTEYDEKSAKYIQIVEGKDATTGKIRGVIKQFRQKHGEPDDSPVVVIVDSLQRIRTGMKRFDDGGNQSEKIDRITSDLKAISQDSNVAMIAVSEITKQAFADAEASGQVAATAFKDSAGIGHLADVLMVLQSKKVLKKGAKERVDQLDLFFEGKEMTESWDSFAEEEEKERVRTEHVFDPKAFSTFSRLSILENRSGPRGNVLFRHDMAYHTFVPVDFIRSHNTD